MTLAKWKQKEKEAKKFRKWGTTARKLTTKCTPRQKLDHRLKGEVGHLYTCSLRTRYLTVGLRPRRSSHNTHWKTFEEAGPTSQFHLSLGVPTLKEGSQLRL